MRWFGLLVLLLTLPLQAVPPEERTLILVSIDGMRWDYLERHAPPHLQELAREGVRAERLRPTFPSKTYPNHYTLVTGLRVERHGIVGNDMFDPASGRFFRLADRAAVTDPRWWGGEPIWVTAERQGRTAACMFWPGSEVEIDGVRPTHWRPYDHDLPGAARIDQVLSWLNLPPAERPAVITLYFAAVDDAGHRYGPEAPETRQALHEVDAHLGRLVEVLRQRPWREHVSLIVAADHGMAAVSPDRLVFLDDVLDLTQVQVDLTGPMAGLRPTGLSAEACLAALRRLPHVRVLPKSDLPARLGYAGHARAPDILVIADEGWRVTTRARWAHTRNPGDGGDHGFDTAYGSMDATFIAWGPAFRRGVRIQPVDNIHVYELMCATLGLAPAANDGDRRLAEAVLAPQ